MHSARISGRSVFAAVDDDCDCSHATRRAEGTIGSVTISSFELKDDAGDALALTYVPRSVDHSACLRVDLRDVDSVIELRSRQSLRSTCRLVLAKTYDKFWCATEEGHHQISCSDDRALLTDVSIRKVYRRTQMCAPDDHSEYLVHCQAFIDASACEGNKTCTIDISSRDYLQCGEKTYAPTYFFVKYTCIQSNRSSSPAQGAMRTLANASSHDVHRDRADSEHPVRVHHLAGASSSDGRQFDVLDQHR